MNYEAIFSASNLLAVPFWFLMIVLPNWQWTRRIISSPYIVLPAALAHAALFFPNIETILDVLFDPTLTNFRQGLSNPGNAVLTWLHFVAYDLFVTRWMYLDSQALKINPWLMAFLFVATIMLGPFGFAIYLLVRLLFGGRLTSA